MFSTVSLVKSCPVSFRKRIISSKTKNSALVIAPSLNCSPLLVRKSDDFWQVEAWNSNFLRFRGAHPWLTSACLWPYGFEHPLHLQLVSHHLNFILAITRSKLGCVTKVGVSCLCLIFKTRAIIVMLCTLWFKKSKTLFHTNYFIKHHHKKPLMGNWVRHAVLHFSQ